MDHLRALLNNIFNMNKTRGREMKRVFQWRRYLNQKELTPVEKLTAKRFFLILVFAYLVMVIFNQNFSLIILLLITYMLYKKYERGGIVKK